MMKEFCKKYNITEEQFYGSEKINGDLDLNSLKSIPEGFNPTVGRDLYLFSLELIPEGFNPTVGGSLYLNSLKSNYTELSENYLFSWQNGKYIKIDEIFSEVIQKRGNVWKLKKINKNEFFYCISDGNIYAHGNTIKEAKQDLLFKKYKRNPEQYKELNLNSILTFDESIICYRVITGACQFGTNDFLLNKLKEKKKEYSIQEIITLTAGEYGNIRFSEFFA